MCLPRPSYSPLPLVPSKEYTAAPLCDWVELETSMLRSRPKKECDPRFLRTLGLNGRKRWFREQGFARMTGSRLLVFPLQLINGTLACWVACCASLTSGKALELSRSRGSFIASRHSVSQVREAPSALVKVPRGSNVVPFWL